MVFKFLNHFNVCIIKILFRKKWRAEWSQGILAIIRCRISCLRVCYPKI